MIIKKGLLLVLLFIVVGCYTGVEASTFDKTDMQGFVEGLSLSVPEWENPVVKKSETLYDVDNTVIGTLYRVFEKKIQSGYFVYLDDYGIVEVTFEGSDKATEINGKVYYSFPGSFFDKDFKDSIRVIESTDIQEPYYGSGIGYIFEVEWNWFNVIETIDQTEITYDFSSGVPYLPINVLSSSSGYHTQKWVDNVPDFLNYDDDYACVPTATAMMMAYYDNEYRDSWTSHDVGDYPLIADGSSNSEAEGLIEEFIDEMHSDKGWGGTDGTSIHEFSAGLTTYFDGTLYPYYDAYISFINDPDPTTVNEYTDYKILIDRGNPAVLFMHNLPSSPYATFHSVAGIGYFSNAYMGNGFLVYDEVNHGITLINDDFVMYFGFIYND